MQLNPSFARQALETADAASLDQTCVTAIPGLGTSKAMQMPDPPPAEVLLEIGLGVAAALAMALVVNIFAVANAS